MAKKILIVTYKFPWPMSGASETDRARGILQFQRLGYKVEVIAKVEINKLESVQTISNETSIPMFPITYKHSKTNVQKFIKYVKSLFTHPLLLDGAAIEYNDTELVTCFKKRIESFKPDIIWLDATFMWPLSKFVDRRKSKIIIRSHNNEALHFWEEEKKNIKNFILYQFKKISERKSARLSDTVCAINPNEATFYKNLGAKKVVILPLRGLPSFLQDSRHIRDTKPLNVFFAGSTYNVKHNMKALLFLIKEVIPAVNRKLPNAFVFHIFGGKLPKNVIKLFSANVHYHGYVEDYEDMMKKMDIALIPVLAGRGMQQKIFEPLVRGIPTITSVKGMSGYPFKDKEHLLLADNRESYVAALEDIKDSKLRNKLSTNSLQLSKKLFSRKVFDARIIDIIENSSIICQV